MSKSFIWQIYLRCRGVSQLCFIPVSQTFATNPTSVYEYWLTSSRSTQDKAHCALFSRCLFHTNEEPAHRTFQSSHMCTVGRWWRIYPTSIFLSIIQRWLLIHLAFEDLFVGLPKIFGEKCIYNGVHRRIAVSQAVCSYSEEKGGLSQWENSKFSP